MKFRNTFFWILILISICLGIFWVYYRDYEITTNHILLDSKIISISSSYKNIPSFSCEISYSGTIKKIGSNSNVAKKNIFIGKTFPMAYSPKINKGQILITPEDFKEFNIPFPDSLNWVLDYRY